jgi:hypothetical protein
MNLFVTRLLRAGGRVSALGMLVAERQVSVGLPARLARELGLGVLRLARWLHAQRRGVLHLLALVHDRSVLVWLRQRCRHW